MKAPDIVARKITEKLPRRHLSFFETKNSDDWLNLKNSTRQNKTEFSMKLLYPELLSGICFLIRYPKGRNMKTMSTFRR